MAPPSTPAQSRFILPRKGQAPQTQKQTPVASQSGSHQFASTPRFNISATHRQASLQPPPFSTPAPPLARPRATPYEPLSDAIDTSPISSETTRHDDEGIDKRALKETIEIDSPSATRSSLGQDEPPPKRRRVSISPEVGTSSDSDVISEAMEEYEEAEITSTPMLDNGLPIESPSIDSQDAMADLNPQSRRPPEEQARRRPTFQIAPRFKVNEAADGAQQRPLPDAFSPQRRGAKYVPGGLAAEVRDWLIQVKGDSEYDRPAGSSIGVTVGEAKSGFGMHIIKAQQLDDKAKDEGIPTRAILAGDGRTTGLGVKSIVKSGGQVSIMSSKQHDEDNGSPDKYERLEQLLHQIFALAGEIAADKGQGRARSDGHLPEECIVLRKEATGSVRTGTVQQTIEHTLPKTSSFPDDIEDKRNGSQGPSAARSVQEPFSPGTLALSLAAIAEHDRGPEGSFNDSGSNTSLVSPRSPETPNKNHDLLSIEEVQEYNAIAQQGSSSIARQHYRRRGAAKVPTSLLAGLQWVSFRDVLNLSTMAKGFQEHERSLQEHTEERDVYIARTEEADD
ncbi:hypothetical protein SLS53_002468 [Cytospora paraplurivora]|uniref:Uncharacterized protein n=1 Tax=Cytospora paraplurivora TaxID=2898453 RepID=A0AAN9YKV9_9PEZI